MQENLHNINSSAREKILVTGATGLVGSHLIKALVRCKKNVVALYRTSIPQFEDADKVEWLQGDILDISSLEEATQGANKVYHCAAIVSFNPKQKKLLNATNIEGTTNVVNACLEKNVEKLLYVSSVSALGRMRVKEMI